MTIPDRGRKILWAKGGGRRSRCRCELMRVGELPSFVVNGETPAVHSIRRTARCNREIASITEHWRAEAEPHCRGTRSLWAGEFALGRPLSAISSQQPFAWLTRSKRASECRRNLAPTW